MVDGLISPAGCSRFIDLIRDKALAGDGHLLRGPSARDTCGVFMYA